MKKYIFQKGIVALCAFLVLAIVWTASGMGWDEWLLFVTLAVSMVWSYNVFDELFAKIFWYRYAITIQFLGLTAIFAAGLVLFCVSAFATSFAIGLTCILLSLACVVGGILYHWYLYNRKDYQSFETDQMKWLIAVCKGLKGKSPAEVEERVYEFLRFLPKRNVLEAPLSLNCPVDPTHQMRTIKEMNEENPGEDYVIEATNKVHEMVLAYCDKYYNPEKVEPVEEEV